MTSAIAFLETLGKRAPLSPMEYQAAVASLEIAEPTQAALARRDRDALVAQLDGRARMYLAICTPDKHDAPDSEEQPDEEQEDRDPAPDRDA